MAGSLILVDEYIVTSGVTSVSLGGSNWNSNFNVYMLKLTDVACNTDTTIKMRFTYNDGTPGTPDTSANYDRAMKQLREDSTFNNTKNTNQDSYGMGSISTPQEKMFGIYYLFNFNNSSEYSFATVEDAFRNTSQFTRSNNGGFVLTQTRANDGLQVLTGGTNTITRGTFSLFGIRK